MLKTKKYSSFKFKPENRPINQLNLNNIVKSMRRKNLMALVPVIVDKDMNIIDGQHRVKAAEILGEDVYYQISESVVNEDIILLNSAKKTWTSQEYAHYYAKMGNKTYQQIVEAAKILKTTIHNATILVGCKGGANDFHKNFKLGLVNIDLSKELEKLPKLANQAQIVADLIENKTVGYQNYLRSTYFKRAQFLLFDNPAFNFDIFMKKLQICIGKVHAASKISEYYQMLKNIYNYRNSEPIE